MKDTAVITPIARRHRDYYAGRTATSFAVRTVSGKVFEVGPDEPLFTFAAYHPRGEKALASLDQFQIGVAYLEGWLDVEGDLTAALAMRGFFRDFHPVTW